MKPKSIHWISKSIIAGLIVAASVSTSYALSITPADGILNTSRWEGNDTKQGDINIVINGLIGNSVELYKQNVGDAFDTGAYKSYYTTVFSETLTDPSAATITWDGSGNFFIPADAYLLVKDGNQTPAWYLFNLTALNWDGKNQLVLTGFWPNRGAISHVAFYGDDPSGGPVPVPDGSSTIAMLGLAFGVLGLLRPRRSR